MRSGNLYKLSLKWAPGIIFLGFVLQMWFSARLSLWIHPEPAATAKVQRMDRKVASTLRAIAFLSGFKVLVGHAFWIKVIQYYGDASNSLTRYANLYDYCVLASDLNPKFVSIYTFGAAALAFHLKRVDEAERLLAKGLAANPNDQRLAMMAAAIGYQNTNHLDKVIPILEQQIMQGDAPYMMVNILANTYEKVGRYEDAINLWRKIQKDTDSDDVRIQAAQKLQELYSIIKSRKH